MQNTATMSKSPGPTLQWLNRKLHRPPASFMVYGVFWWFILAVVCPLIGVGLLIKTILQSLVYFALLPLGRSDNERIHAKTCEKELAVVITGCDSGFGKDAALELSKRGFIVFAGCLNENGMRQFKDIPNIIPLELDVTNEKHVSEAASTVSSWLSDPKADLPRSLHAVINNAGIGSLGFVDWLELPSFRRVMEVNYFGMVSVTKSFLPILKSQACSGSHKDARIINLVSMAGLSAGPCMSPYTCSKYAAEAFSEVLSLELKTFDLKVVTLNPSFHKTPLTSIMSEELDKVWNNLSEELKHEYGKDLHLSFKNEFEKVDYIMWESDNVTYSIVSAVEKINPPVQIRVGADAKYLFTPFAMLPTWFRYMVSIFPEKAAKMK